MNATDKIHRLRVLCGGIGSNPWYRHHHHNPIKNCEILLIIEGFEKALNDPLRSATSWIRLANVLLPLTDRNEKFKTTFINLLNLVLDHKDVDGRDEFLSNVWKNSEESNICLELHDIEEFIKKEPKYIESKIIDIVEEILKRNNLKPDEINVYWKNVKFSVLIKWCIRSSVIFSVITSILNEILFCCSGENFIKVLNLIRSFVYHLSKTCVMEGKNFVNLYPLQYRHLVYLFKCKPNEFIIDENIEQKLTEEMVPVIQDELEKRPDVIIALLTHHLAWCSEFISS